MPNEFSHKGVTISLDGDGTFWFINKGGTTVTKPSLKAAKNAIDKEVGQVIVPAMTGEGKKVEVVGTHRTQGYLDRKGYQVGKYQRLFHWSDEAAQKLEAIRERERDEEQRHRDAAYELAQERMLVLNEVGVFSYTGALSKELARAPRSAEEKTDA